jgi:hypothetical protein
MRAFQRGDDGSLFFHFTSQESQVLRNLLEQLLEILGDEALIDLDPLMNLMGLAGSDTPPDDPVLKRLLPDAYSDEKDAGEFRRYTEYGLREKKRFHARLLYQSLAPESSDLVDVREIDRSSHSVKIAEDEAMAWLGSFNDLRLALAVRLEIGGEIGKKSKQEDDEHRRYEVMRESDPMKAVYAVYSWLGWLQQSLLEEITNQSRRD